MWTGSLGSYGTVKCRPRALYLGVIARIEFFSDWDNVLFEEFEPLLLKADLVHVGVHSGDVFITTGQTLVLNTNTGRTKLSKLNTVSSRQTDRQTGSQGTLWDPPDHSPWCSMVSTR